jgi:hypothetical protein
MSAKVSKLSEKRAVSLYQKINQLPTTNVNVDDIKALCLTFIQELPSSEDHAAYDRVKLDAMRLLLECVKTDNQDDFEQELMSVLNKDD